jgi:hypothetical protein
MSEIASIELLSARHTFQNGTLWRLGHLRLAVIICQPTTVRNRALEGQRDESVGAATDTELRQRFYILLGTCPFRLSATGRKNGS